MTMLCDRDIRNLCMDANGYELASPMIHPFTEGVSGNSVISYGLTSAGYDLRLALPEDNEGIIIFKNLFGEWLDPKAFRDTKYHNRIYDRRCIDANGTFTIPPNCYVLGRSHEYLRIPTHLKGRCVGKSTLARVGVIINTTPLEPGWHGYLTIEIGNITPCPIKMYCLEGIAQLEFEILSGIPDVTYESKQGQYQAQMSVTTARVKE